MRTKRTKWAVLLGLLLICAFVALTIANGIQTDHGNIVVTEGVIDAYRGEGGAEHLGMLTYKLYTPRTATAATRTIERPTPPTPLSWPAGAWWSCPSMNTATAFPSPVSKSGGM